MWAVRVTLQRPYSFVVLASLNRDIRRDVAQNLQDARTCCIAAARLAHPTMAEGGFLFSNAPPRSTK
jgi:hypothetical protein